MDCLVPHAIREDLVMVQLTKTPKQVTLLVYVKDLKAHCIKVSIVLFQLKVPRLESIIIILMDFVARKISPYNLYQYIIKCPYLSHTDFVLKYDRAILLIYLNLTVILKPM